MSAMYRKHRPESSMKLLRDLFVPGASRDFIPNVVADAVAVSAGAGDAAALAGAFVCSAGCVGGGGREGRELAVCTAKEKKKKRKEEEKKRAERKEKSERKKK